MASSLKKKFSEEEQLAEAIENYDPAALNYTSRFLTAYQVAEILDVSRGTVKRWVRSCKLGSFRVGTIRRIPYIELGRFLAGGYSGEENPYLAAAKHLLARMEPDTNFLERQYKDRGARSGI